jgi:hypothetical protein
LLSESSPPEAVVESIAKTVQDAHEDNTHEDEES